MHTCLLDTSKYVFIFYLCGTGSCELLPESSWISVLNYKVNKSGNMSATINCTQQNINATYEILCDNNATWSIDILDNCTLSNDLVAGTYMFSTRFA